MQDRQTAIAEETAMRNMHSFIEKIVTTANFPRCIDGRPAPESEQGPQMLGGSLHPVLLAAIYQGLDLEEGLVEKYMGDLHGSGVKTEPIEARTQRARQVIVTSQTI